ncbi:MAG: PAS domain S-box protein, partial [Bryobacteraceae bacterium]
MTGSSQNVLQKLVDTALRLCQAHSAGISLLEEKNGQKIFRWRAVAGRWSGFTGGTMPRDSSPCGTVLDRNCPLIMSHPDRYYPIPADVAPPIAEVLLIPFHIAGKPVGTIWVIAHDESRQFDGEDQRLLTSLGKFAAAACQVLDSQRLLRESEYRFRAMIDALPAAIYTTDGDGRLTHFNPAAIEFSGRVPELGTDQWCVSWKLYSPDGTPLPHDECPMAVALKEGHIVRGSELIAERPDGKRIWVAPYPTPLCDSDGRLAGGINMLVDITDRKLADEALRRSEANLRDFIENASVGLHWVGPDGVILWANQTELDLLGYTREEYIGHDIAEFHANEPAIDDLLARLLRGETVREYEARLRSKDGSIRHVLINSNGLFEDGKFVHTRCFIRDITERKKAEEALRESEHKFRLLFERSPLPKWAFNLQTLRFVDVNAAACRRYGYSREEFLGMSLLDVLTPEAGEAFQSTLARSSRPPETDTCQHRKKSGEVIDVEVQFSEITLAGKRVLLASVNDITERKRAETALRDSEAYFRDLTQQMPHVVWTSQPDGRMEFVNRRWLELTGQTLEYVLSAADAWMTAVHPDDLEDVRSTYLDGVRSGQSFMMQVRFRRAPDGAYRWHMNRAVPLHDAAGQVLKFLGTCTDIDDQKRATEDLMRANEDLRQFAFAASHDLQEPLRMMTSYSQLLVKKYGGTMEGEAEMYV